MARRLNAPKLSPFLSSANYFLVAGVFTFCAQGYFFEHGVSRPLWLRRYCRLCQARDASRLWRETMATVAEQFVTTLAAAGVKRIYGIVGDSLNGLT